MVKLKVLEGTRRLNTDDSSEAEDKSEEISTSDQAVETDPFVNTASVAIQAFPIFGHSIGVQTPPRSLEFGWTKRVVAITHSVCKGPAEQQMIMCTTRHYFRTRLRTKPKMEQLLIFLARTRLIRNRMCCLHCPRRPFMHLTPRISHDEDIDAWRWECPQCGRCVSVRFGSRLFQCRIPLHQLVDSLYLWCHKNKPSSYANTKRLPELWWSRIRLICVLDEFYSRRAQPAPVVSNRTSGVRTTKSRYRRRGPTSMTQLKPIDIRKPAPRGRNRAATRRWKKAHNRDQLAALIYACRRFQNRKR